MRLSACSAAALFLWGCGPPERPAPLAQPAPGDILERPKTRLPALPSAWPAGTYGQTIYVPVYSQVLTMTARRSYALTANVVIHNTDPDVPIRVLSARYYRNGGELITEYLEAPKALLPFSSKTLIVDQLDREGGIGANFVVDWLAEARVSPPVIEALMIGEAGTGGVSFISQGRVIREYPAPSDAGY